ncbi:MAG TPA: hypothetical protein VMT95_02075 [Candidatus Binatia bacterium]|nr:hypothetical protein [Candidatus Binatia bacterium]
MRRDWRELACEDVAAVAEALRDFGGGDGSGASERAELAPPNRRADGEALRAQCGAAARGICSAMPPPPSSSGIASSLCGSKSSARNASAASLTRTCAPTKPETFLSPTAAS